MAHMKVSRRRYGNKSWRDYINVHPACETFPLMPAEELQALGEDIKANGMTAPIIVWSPKKRPADLNSLDPAETLLLDGRNRLDALEATGVPVIMPEGGLNPRITFRFLFAVSNSDAPQNDPWDYVISANILRRHLTPAQKADVIARILARQPDRSNREIGKLVKADHHTVGTVRERLERTGELPKVSATVGRDGRTRRTTEQRLADGREDQIRNLCMNLYFAKPEIRAAELARADPDILAGVLARKPEWAPVVEPAPPAAAPAPPTPAPASDRAAQDKALQSLRVALQACAAARVTRATILAAIEQYLDPGNR